MSSSRRTQKVTATLELAGESFKFQLFTRPIKLGDAATVQYYWIDGGHFRKLRSDADCECFRNVIGHWAAAMRYEGCWHELDQQVHFVWAIAYALVARDKSLQDVYLDAHLKKVPRPEEHSLPPETQERIQAVVKSQDRFLLQAELDHTLKFQPLPGIILPAFQEAARRWLGNGVTALRKDGSEGLEGFMKNELEPWLRSYRKRSSPLVRAFINAFSYESKVAFNTCYANLWVQLIPWLKAHRELDTVSEKFLWFWHWQNQPIELPAGQTASGFVYPTRRGAQIVETRPDGRQKHSALIVLAERVGPAYLSDVFRGQVLALHPLSAFFMQDPGLCAIAGKYFASDLHALEKVGLVGSKYWDLVGAILTAASLYRQAYDLQAPTRSTRFVNAAGSEATTSGGESSEALLLEDFALHTGRKCETCGRDLRFVRHQQIGSDQEIGKIEYACAMCPGTIELDVTYEALTGFFETRATRKRHPR